MNWQRIKAIIQEEIFITKRSLEVINDLPFFSFINVLVFGLFTQWLGATTIGDSAKYLLIGVMLWEVIRITQYSMSVSSLWNIWSRCLSSIFVTPISMKEYITAHMLSGIIKTVTIMVVLMTLVSVVFGFSLWSLGWLNLLVWFINLTIFSWWTGLLILGLILRYGTRIQAMAWGLIFLFQPLTAAFFPVSVLPSWLQVVAFALPPTFVFEAARAALVDGGAVNWFFTGVATGENILYFGLSLMLFQMMYRQSRVTGQFARNEG